MTEVLGSAAGSAGAALLAIAFALVAMCALVGVVEALRAGSSGVAPISLGAAAEDAGVAFYLSQLVGVSFFQHTGELRFAAMPGLALVGLSIVFATAIAVRLAHRSRRAKVRLAMLVPVAYALFAGLGALLVPLHFSARGYAESVPVQPSVLEAFLLPFGWAALFASMGALVGLHGKGWRREASRLLGAWAPPLGATLRVLAASLAACAAVAIAAGLALTGTSFGQSLETLGAALLALPTLIATVFLASFGVSVDWHLDALGHGEGSLSAFGGTLPTTGPDLSNELSGAVALLPLLGLATVLSIGWLSARGSGEDVKGALGNALRAGALLTVLVWAIGLLARIDAQAGGLLGFHSAPDAGSLLWLVPLWSVLGCFAGASAWALTRGPESRRRLAETLAGAMNATPGGALWPDSSREGVVRRASASLAFAAVPAMLVAIGPSGAQPSPQPPSISYAPIEREAERQLESDSSSPGAVEVTVNPTTRAISTASARIPVEAVDAKPGEPPIEKARAVLAEYGELFGLSSRPAELGRSRAETDQLGMTHVTFEQMVAGVPVFGSRIGVHFSPSGRDVTFIGGSTVPDVSVADGEARLDRDTAIARAKQALPAGELVQPPRLQVFAGVGPEVSGRSGRLAWIVWLLDDRHQASNEYVIDAVDGTVLKVLNKHMHAKFRQVYDANHGTSLPGTLARFEGQGATGITDVDNAFDFSGDTYDLFSQWFSRDSYNGSGGTVYSTARYDVNYQNAYWNGVQMVFGDGYTTQDIVGHELTHGVTEHTAGLVYEWQSGALNEAFSDVMGETVEFFKKGSVDWLMGAALPGGAIRSLKEPNEYEVLGAPSPKHMSEWYGGCQDNYGVHVNSTIVGHAYYLLTNDIGVQPAAKIFYRALDVYLGPNSTMEDGRNSAVQAAIDLHGNGSNQHNKTVAAFNAVGLNGSNHPPPPNCGVIIVCAFGAALEAAEPDGDGEGASAASMLSTLYKARGELALPSAAGKYFMPLYEEHMGRISELVAQDPELAEMAVTGLEEATPALEALIEGEAEEFELAPELMGEIEAALERLAEDDRLFEGPNAGELADLIEEEMSWMGLSSYGGMDYEAGWDRLNDEVEAHTMMVETGEIIDPNCMGYPYPNDFQVNGLYIDTPGHRIPGQVSPLNAGGVICGALVEPNEGTSGCVGEESLNTEVAAQLPPGTAVNPSENLPHEAWVGETIGRAIACAGDETQILYGQAGLLSLESWNESQCPAEAIACYEGRTKYQHPLGGPITGKGYSWVSEGEGETLTFTSRPILINAPEGYKIKVSFGQFEVKLCGRAGSTETKSCGGPAAPWVHRNGEASEAGCPEGKGRYFASATNAAEEETEPASACVRWDEPAQMQTVSAPDSLNAVGCIPSTSSCVAGDDEGDLFYATNVSPSGPASWSSWNGPGPSPTHAVECPSASLCLVAAGEVGAGGGNMYRTSSLGGSFLTSFSPPNGVSAISCPSASFCVSTLQGGGFIRYSTNPSSFLWTAVAIGSGAMNDVSCLSSSFCAVVDASGNVRIATTEKGVKEAPGWTATNVNEGEPLEAIDCSSTSSCVAIDGSGEVLNLTIEGAKAEVERQELQGAAELTDLTCTGEDCVATDDAGGVFASADAGETWQKRLATVGDIRSVSCASPELCVSVDTAGDIAMFDPE